MGLKNVMCQVDEMIYKEWKDTGAKARVIFEEGLKYRKVSDDNVKLVSILENIKKEHEAVVEKHLKAHAHMKEYLDAAIAKEKIALEENVQLRAEIISLRNRLAELAPKLAA